MFRPGLLMSYLDRQVQERYDLQVFTGKNPELELSVFKTTRPPGRRKTELIIVCYGRGI